MVAKWQAFGGVLAAALIIGPVWLLNHGMAQPLITQSGPTFIDMGLATAVGIFVYGIFSGGKVKPALLNVAGALLGGILAGIFLSFIH